VRGVHSTTDLALPGLWPTYEQSLVLKAALLPAEPARAAFHEWLALADFEGDFDNGTFRLLPLLYSNMRRHGIEHGIMSRLKGIYRLTWYKNNKLFHDLHPVIEALSVAGIPIMLLKGVPLALLYYRNVALRPMADIDVLVPPEMVSQALAEMTRFAHTPFALASSDYLKYRHAMQYWSESSGEIDLHWHALYETCDGNYDDVFWKTARPLEFNGIRCQVPDATWMFFHTVIHGVRWNAEPPIRWIADAMTILRSTDNEIDWIEMSDYAHKLKLSYRLHLGLDFLKKNFLAPVPDSILLQLKNGSVSIVERLENTCILRDPAELHKSPLGHLWIGFINYCRFARNHRPIKFIAGFSHYVRFHWKLRGRSEIPGYIARGTFKRVCRLFCKGRESGAAKQ
jgi:hypothetical protein